MSIHCGKSSDIAFLNVREANELRKLPYLEMSRCMVAVPVRLVVEDDRNADQPSPKFRSVE